MTVYFDEDAAQAAPATDCGWLLRHFEALYTRDALGRLVGRREPGDLRPPRFHLGRTRHGNLWCLRDDVPDTVVGRLSRLAGREGPLPPGDPPWRAAERVAALRSLLDEDRPVVSEWAGPALRFPVGFDASKVPASGAVDDFDAGDPHALRALEQALPALAGVVAERTPCVVARVAGRIVSACYVAAGDARTVAEAGVETAADFRGRGHGTACVAAWAVRVVRHGGTPLYSTSWDNRASLAVSRKLGLIPFAEDLHWT